MRAGIAVGGERRDAWEASPGVLGIRPLSRLLEGCFVVVVFWFPPLHPPFLGKSISLTHVFLFSEMSGVGEHQECCVCETCVTDSRLFVARLSLSLSLCFVFRAPKRS